MALYSVKMMIYERKAKYKNNNGSMALKNITVQP